jgi:hypothetical protein
VAFHYFSPAISTCADRPGIADDVRLKTVLAKSGSALGIMFANGEAEVSRALVKFLRTPEAATVIKAKGMELATQ